MQRLLENAALVTRIAFAVCLVFMFTCRAPMHAQQQDLDSIENEKIGRVDDHLRATDRTVEDNKAEMKGLQGQFHDLEAQVNEWKGAQDVWLRIISLLAGGGIVLQVSGKFTKQKEKEKAP